MEGRDVKVLESYFLKPIPLIIMAVIVYDLFTTNWWWAGMITLGLFYNGRRWSHHKQRKAFSGWVVENAPENAAADSECLACQIVSSGRSAH